MSSASASVVLGFLALGVASDSALRFFGGALSSSLSSSEELPESPLSSSSSSSEADDASESSEASFAEACEFVSGSFFYIAVSKA